ncbi:cell division protein FtsI [Roseateles sp. DAIF2]|uniref:cell division protein FtsI n=1 Tax=Roseateles sp. DAIF2 TaxID=2714952 RepID=UPI00201E50D1|nr:cell division protein FtsI [Roseateles sp. DAIF2]
MARARALLLIAPLLAAALSSGCSVFSPAPAWELIKAGSGVAGTALAYGPSRASQTVHHGEPVPGSVCIEFNRDVQSGELVPALQAELRGQRVASRVYEAGTDWPDCRIWLRYVASIQWGEPPLSSGYKPYLSAAALSLHHADGRLLSSSSYQLDDGLGMGRWSSTRDKLAPVVKALLTGFEN